MNDDNNARIMMADAKFYESYSRFDEEQGRYETWDESVDRIMDMHRTKYADKITPELEEYMNFATEMYKSKRVLGSQRALQFGGKQILSHEIKLYNCLSSYADRPRFFGEMFYALLGGCGAGFSAQKHHVSRLPMIRPRTKQAKTHVVGDSIEGWATALDVLLSSFFMGGGVHPEYEGRKVYFDYNQIREKGSKISGGFIAPGPDGLSQSMNRIERLLTSVAEEGVLRPIVVYDIVMHMADAVLSGGVRRSATCCIFSSDDKEMMEAKTGDWFHKNPQRARSNNSVALLRKELEREELGQYIDYAREHGEPGVVLLNSLEHTLNPCFEIGMYPQIDGKSGFQGCNLTEINGSLCDTPENFIEACEAAAILGTLQAGYTNFKFFDDVTREIFEREALLGVSVTGWMNNPNVLLKPDVQQWGARTVKRINQEVARLLDINPAARCTTVKPSGNASVLLETTSALSGEHSQRYLRNVQFPKNQPVAKVMANTNPYMVEDSVWSSTGSDVVVSFPIVAPYGSVFKDYNCGVEMLKNVSIVQRNWIDEGINEERLADPGLSHNVSNTVVVRDNEWEKVVDFVYINRDFFCGLSFVPSSADRDYPQAPFVEVRTAQEIIERYGQSALFASGLIVDVRKGFANLWEACDVAVRGYTVGAELEDLGKDWVRRFCKFANNYHGGNLRETEMLLKDVYLLHKWTKIQTNFENVDFAESLRGITRWNVEIDALSGVACYGGTCEI